jgi:hypothetical protein
VTGLIRKFVFLENNSTTSEYFMRMKVIKLVSFLTSRITEKNTMFSMRNKFMSSIHIGSICKTPKNSKMMVWGWFVIKAFERSFVAKKWHGQTIN